MSRHRRPAAKAPANSEVPDPREPAQLRIVGGSLRGRKLAYSGDVRTRPMKDRVREALFNLVGPAVREKHAIDLFSGTGALGFEALSRGAARATMVEQHFPTAGLIRQNAAQLGVAGRCQVVPANVFIWAQMQTAPDPLGWVVFCSPPYAFYVDRQTDMLSLIEGLLTRAAPGSVMVVECDARFDVLLLPDADNWDVREYPPAVVAVYHKLAPSPPSSHPTEG